eukprot:CAMPEP_0119351570 /NCGR_PEP_ID=MMETSP1334-20130426/867_1 /TAXON_ID=127549 /ORGANISM="Calcidiscus leptoporus, Strain RCC1130" /LENGTH=393 /DNA_ID=CAMNT_0007364407 /DNA_START=39 /DNA_END=1220 /DNA_ORIENTATION=+
MTGSNPMKRQRTASLPAHRRVCFIGAPFCEGQNLDGTDLAPTALREAGIKQAVEKLGWQWEDKGDIDFAAHFGERGMGDAQSLHDHHHSVALYRAWLQSGMRDNFSTWVQRFGQENGAMRRSASGKNLVAAAAHADGQREVVNSELIGEGLKLIYETADHAASSGSFVLTVGGDHSIAAGTIAAMQRTYPSLGVIWVDAHADANTPDTSPSMHYHGMPAAHLLGWFEQTLKGFDWFTPGCLSENRLAYIGLRDIDKEEAAMLKESNVAVYTMRDIDKHGIAKVIEMAIAAIDPNSNRPLHLSLDIDAVDPHFAPGTGTCARGGLTYREIHYVCEEMALTNRLVGMDLVEVNPSLDPPPAGAAMHGDDPNLHPASPTVQLGVELSLSALGKTIL